MRACRVFVLGLVCLWGATYLEGIGTKEDEAFWKGEDILWRGEARSDGTPTATVPLKLGRRYQIRASKVVSLGKTNKEGDRLLNDACFEYNSAGKVEKLETLKNSLNIPLCQGYFHDNHTYTSEVFVTEHNRVFFWVSDFDYDINNGSFQVEVIRR